MSGWEQVRSLARHQNAVLLKGCSEPYTAEGILRAAEVATGIHRIGLPKGHTLLYGSDAVLDSEAQVIWFDQDLDNPYAQFCQAHEFAHHWLGHRSDACVAG